MTHLQEGRLAAVRAQRLALVGAVLAALALPTACSDTPLSSPPMGERPPEVGMTVPPETVPAQEPSTPEHIRMAMEAVRLAQEAASDARILDAFESARQAVCALGGGGPF